MIFGKHINRYYFKYAGWLILGLIALVTVDALQLEIPALYAMVVNGMNNGYVTIDGKVCAAFKIASVSAEVTEADRNVNDLGADENGFFGHCGGVGKPSDKAS